MFFRDVSFIEEEDVHGDDSMDVHGKSPKCINEMHSDVMKDLRG